LGIGDWGLGVGGGGVGVGGFAHTPHPPIPNPQSPIPNPHNIHFLKNKSKFNNYILNYLKYLKYA